MQSSDSGIRKGRAPLFFGLALAGCGAAVATPALPVQMTAVELPDLPSSSAPCLVFRDLNRDGAPDLVLAPLDNDHSATGQLAIYLNRSGGKFERHTLSTGLPQINTCAAGDYDNDGWPDLAVVGPQNSGTGLVILRSEFAPPSQSNQPLSYFIQGSLNPSTVGFLDADGDGWLDLAVAFSPDGGIDRFVSCDPVTQVCMLDHPPVMHPLRIFHNEKGASFTALPALAHPTTGYDNTANFIDWNGDGLIDIFESIDYGSNLFWSGPDWNEMLGPMKARFDNHAMGVGFADYDKNGRWDFYIAETGRDQFYLGQADGTIANAAGLWGVEQATRFHIGWSPVPADLNNDGWVDLFVVNSALAADARDFNKQLHSNWVNAAPIQADYLLVNQEGSRFSTTSILHPPPATSAEVGHGAAAVADYDGDGLLDVAEVFNSKLGFRLLHNTTPASGNHWLGVTLVGTRGNRDAMGAFVILRDGDHEIDRLPIGSGGSATSSLEAHFGLGARTSVPSLEIHWPGGRTQMVSGPFAADQVVTVTEQ